MASFMENWMKFCGRHIKTLWSSNTQTKQHEPSLIVAVSCFFYLMPAIWMITALERPTKWIDFILYSLTSAVSFGNDYYYVNDVDAGGKMNCLDHWTVASVISYNFCKCYLFYDSALDYLWASGATIGALFFLKQSGDCYTEKEWVLWHTIWHLWAALVNFLVIWNEVMYVPLGTYELQTTID
eukprot:425697_1